MKTMKLCNICKREKDLFEFPVNRDNKSDGHRAQCKECWNAKRAVWYATHRNKHREYNRKYYQKHGEEQRKRGREKYYMKPDVHLRRRYGINKKQVDEMIILQNNKCAICGIQMDAPKNRHIDHDHKNNIIRMILCANCNRGIGMFQDNPILLETAAAYLRGFNAAY